MFVGPPKRVSR